MKVFKYTLIVVTPDEHLGEEGDVKSVEHGAVTDMLNAMLGSDDSADVMFDAMMPGAAEWDYKLVEAHNVEYPDVPAAPDESNPPQPSFEARAIAYDRAVDAWDLQAKTTLAEELA